MPCASSHTVLSYRCTVPHANLHSNNAGPNTRVRAWECICFVSSPSWPIQECNRCFGHTIRVTLVQHRGHSDFWLARPNHAVKPVYCPVLTRHFQVISRTEDQRRGFCRTGRRKRKLGMIASVSLLRSVAWLRGRDADSAQCAARLTLVHAHASSASRGKQATVVQRQGSSRTTTYYTSRSVNDSHRAPAPHDGQRRGVGGDVVSSASTPLPCNADVVVESSHLARSGVASGTESIQNGTKWVASTVRASSAGETSVKACTGVAETPRCASEPNLSQNTQGINLELPHIDPGKSQTLMPAIGMDAAVQTEENPAVILGRGQACNTDGLKDHGESADPASLAAFLCNRGFSGLQAERLALELHGENSKLTCIRVLQQQIQKLESILPGMDVHALIVKDSLVLRVDATTAARRLILLDSHLGHPDLTQLIKTAPQLLYAEEVEDRLEHCVKKLLSLLPADYPLQSLQKLLVEAPTIIFRMDYYVSASCLEDLPADLLHQLNGMRGGPHDTSCMI
eukprot:jgi/Ulvmu1/4040/UM019_0017.1